MIRHYLKFHKLDGLAAVLLLLYAAGAPFLLCACAGQNETADSALPDTVFFQLTGIHNAETVGTVNGEAVSAELYLYWLGYSCRYWDQYVYARSGSHIVWSAHASPAVRYADFVRWEAWELVKLQLLTEQWAQTYGAALREEDRLALEQEREAYIRYYGDEEGYLLALHKQGISQETFDRIRRLGPLYARLQALAETEGSPLYPSEAQLQDFAREQGYVTLDCIVLYTVDPATGEALDAEAAAGKRKLAETLLSQLKRSSDPENLFEQLASLYSEEPDRIQHPDGVAYPPDEIPAQWSAAAQLQPGRWTNILTCRDSYCIVLRRTVCGSGLQRPYFTYAFQKALDDLPWKAEPLLKQVDVAAFFKGLPQTEQAG